MHQLIEECFVEVPEEQKQNMEKTMFDLVKICHHKQLLCIHDDVDDLIESALDCKFLSINYQRLDKKEQEVKNDDDDLNSSDDESLFDEDVPAEEFKIYSNPLCNEDEINPHCFNVESDFVEYLLNRDTFIDFSSKFDFSGELEDRLMFLQRLKMLITFLSSDSFFHISSFLRFLLYSSPLRVRTRSLILDYPPEIEVILCWIYVRFPRSSYPLIDFSLARRYSFLEELLIDDSILSHESFDSSFEDRPLIPRPPPEPPDDNFDLEPKVISAVMEDNDEPDEHFNPGG
nr:hypothetical protein [Tanacetum cinerariifolium]